MSKLSIDPTQREIDRALASLGLKGSPSTILDPTDKQEILPSIQEIFSSAGAGLDDAAITVASLMADPSNPHNQLKAAEIALRVHGIFKDEKFTKQPQVTININSTGEAKTLLNLVLPEP